MADQISSSEWKISNQQPFLVGEEMERVMIQWSRSFTRSPSLRLQAMEQPSSLQLWFNKRLSLPIFTGTRIFDSEGNPINIVLMVMDKSNGQVVPTSLPHALKLEIVVLDGDFPPIENEDWTSEEFNSRIVKERSGKRPLLAGEMNLTMRDGIASIGDIEFTDNSSWIRSRKFRVAVMVAPGSNQGGVRIREAMTEAFVVKDHRGELYKKHHPLMLLDDVWRLEKIGKDGAFHRKLLSKGIKTVQDFLKLAVVDTLKLRNILGIGMSEKMWEVTIQHAMTCDMGNKVYIYRGPQFTIFLDPVCKLIRADINGQIISTRDPTSHLNRAYIDRLVKEAYARWHNLEEIDAFFCAKEKHMTNYIDESMAEGSLENQFEKAESDSLLKLYNRMAVFGSEEEVTCRDIKASNILLDNKYGTKEDVENDAWDGKMTSQVQAKYAELFTKFLIATIPFVWFTIDTYNRSSITPVQQLHKQHSPVFIWSSLLEPFCFMVLVWAIATSIVVGASFTRMQSSMLMFWAILMLIKSAKSITEVYVPVLGILCTGCYMLLEKQPELPN